MSKAMTPMLRQYFDIKKDYQNAFLFFRLGDFYELFGDDAKEAARLLGLTLTARHKGTENEIPMCGVPHHSAERYIAQLTKLGRRVAICDQVSDPKLPGIVQREVVKVITPGTTLDESIVDTKKNHYLLSLIREKAVFGLSMLDLATGEFKVTELKELKILKNILFLLDPAEIILPDQSLCEELAHELDQRPVSTFKLPYFENPIHFLEQHFQVSTLEGFGIAHFSVGISAAAALLSYVKETQKTDLRHIKKITGYQLQDVMVLDESTIRNLEIFMTSRDGKYEGSLLSVIEKTITRMGSRKLRQWILSPLTQKDRIDARLEAVAELLGQRDICQRLQQELEGFFDLERLCGRIGCRTSNGRDLNYLKVNLLKIPAIKMLLQQSRSSLLKKTAEELDEAKDLVSLLDQRIHPEPPPAITEGGVIADGFHAELDELRSLLKNGKDWLIDYQQRLREETGIQTLKVKFNKVFGYHIELTKAQAAKVPETFLLKQNLVNANRYMTEELRVFEEKYVTAEERINALEYELFQQTLEIVIPSLAIIQRNAELVATIDVLQSFAELAVTARYCRPSMSEEVGIDIRDGRHAVIEYLLKAQHQSYIANDARLDQEQQIIVLTGPNMAGKSSYLRQTALIVLLAHIGCFVPASSAKIGITDRIFTRVGAADDISSGQSTFMVEMTEAANILNNATERSLIIFDELGRGTSTYDGVSIAWAILEHVAHHTKSLTLFATHYHELIDVAKEIPHAHNYSVAVSEKDGEVIFLRKIVDKGVDRSYGIEVAKLAGLPKSVINRAKQILSELERDRFREEQSLMGIQNSLFEGEDGHPRLQFGNELSPHRRIADELKKMDTNQMTPMEALNYLEKLKTEI